MTLLLLLFACEPEDPCVAAADVAPSLRLGQGETDFAPMAAGDAFDSESGSQGGQHVWVALEASGLAPGGYNLVGDDDPAPETDVRVEDADGVPLAAGRQSQAPWQGDAESATTAGIKTFLEPGWMGRGEVFMDVVVVDVCKTELAERFTVRLR